METVGVFLKKEREAHNISLRELALITKITPMYLEHIEKDEFDKIPQGPYIKGYLSSYARAVGCDVDKAIALYTAAHCKPPQAEVPPPETASNHTGEGAVQTPKATRPKRSRRLPSDQRRSRFHGLVSSAAAGAAAVKAATQTTGAAFLAQMQNRTPFRQRAGGDDPSRFGVMINRWLTARRTWLVACAGLFGGFILFLAGAGFYHLFIYTPASAPVVEAETAPDGEAPLLSSVDPRPSGPPFSSTHAAADAPKGYFTGHPPPEPVASDTAVPGAEPEADRSSRVAGPAGSVEGAASGNALPARQAPVGRDSAAVGSEGGSGPPSIQNDPPPKPAVADAPLRVLKAAVCRAVENRMPAGVDRSFSTSDEKIYVWTQIEARQVPSEIHHVYYFGGTKVSEVALDVRSSNWRTWSAKTIAESRHRGEWRVDIATSEGDVLRRLHYEVR